jgi:hypothetical protein
MTLDLKALSRPFAAEEDTYGRIISSAAVEGMWPFKPDVVDIEMVFDVDYNQHWLNVEARMRGGFNYWRVFHKELVDRDLLATSPHSEVYRLAACVRDAFRFRPTLPNDGYSGHHHHLGAE